MSLLGGIDFQNRVGNKPGTGYQTSAQAQVEQRERLRKLAMESIDLSKDPYFMRNHLGTYECKLCLTLHNTEGNYLAHTQGKRHQMNLKRRAARDALLREQHQPRARTSTDLEARRKRIKIGKPGYRVVKQRDPESGQRSILFEVQYPEIEDGVQPRHRFMSAYEQKVEAPDKNFQYVLFAADPYETIGFKIPNREVDKGEGKFFTRWSKEAKIFSLQLCFVTDEQLEVINQRREKQCKAAPKINYSTFHGRR
jgi:splicing factor 3A subunit 2